MIDLHCHFLPEIDDGPQSMAEAVVLANMAVNNGISKAIVTPHIHPGRYENNKTSISSVFLDFKQTLKNLGVNLSLGMAAEVRLCPEIIPMIKQDQIPFLGKLDGFEIMLLEFPHSHIPFGSDNLVKFLIKQGIKPMIAHPERNKEIMADSNKISPFVNMGCLLQLTAGSLAGKFGVSCKDVAETLLMNNTVSIIATDAHNEDHRPPDLRQGYDCVSKLMGTNIADNLIKHTPEMISACHFESEELQVS